jgi:predicted porin
VSNGGAVTGNSVFNRQSNIALSGGFGTITLGGQVSSYIVGATGTLLPGSIFGAFDVSAIAAQDAAQGGGNTGGFFTRNAVTYSTPDLGGASLSVQKQFRVTTQPALTAQQLLVRWAWAMSRHRLATSTVPTVSHGPLAHPHHSAQ